MRGRRAKSVPSLSACKTHACISCHASAQCRVRCEGSGQVSGVVTTHKDTPPLYEMMPVYIELQKRETMLFIGAPSVTLAMMIVVYWYSFSNPHTQCIHYDNCLVIKKKRVLSFPA